MKEWNWYTYQGKDYLPFPFPLLGVALAVAIIEVPVVEVELSSATRVSHHSISLLYFRV